VDKWYKVTTGCVLSFFLLSCFYIFFFKIKFCRMRKQYLLSRWEKTGERVSKWVQVDPRCVPLLFKDILFCPLCAVVCLL
jgi:hypothetical protein